MPESAITDGLKQHALKFPGTLDEKAQFPRGKARERIAELVNGMRNLAMAIPTHKDEIEAIMDECEREINSGN